MLYASVLISDITYLTVKKKIGIANNVYIWPDMFFSLCVMLFVYMFKPFRKCIIFKKVNIRALIYTALISFLFITLLFLFGNNIDISNAPEKHINIIFIALVLKIFVFNPIIVVLILGVFRSILYQVITNKYLLVVILSLLCALLLGVVSVDNSYHVAISFLLLCYLGFLREYYNSLTLCVVAIIMVDLRSLFYFF